LAPQHFEPDVAATITAVAMQSAAVGIKQITAAR